MVLRKDETLGKISIIESGINIEVEPASLYKQLISGKSQEILDIILTAEYKRIIKELTEFCRELKYDAVKDDPRTCQQKEYLSDQINNYKCISGQVEVLSHFLRHVVKLSSDSEVLREDIENRFSKEEKEAFDWAINLSKYQPMYGYKKSETTTV